MLRKLTLLVLLISVLAACARRPLPTPATPSAYMALAPARMYAGERQAVSLSLWASERPASGWVTVSLQKEGEQVLRTREFVSGKETIEFQVPSQPGQYDLVVSGPGFEDKAQVQVTEGLLIFLETDKPIYKPGQQIEARIVTLDSELLPKPATVTMEVLDAKGIKVARQEVETDEYGMGHFSLPLSSEPNLGTWKITASAQEQKAQVDVRVEKYVLPKYEVKVELQKGWFLPQEAIEGTVAAEYSFGKKVVGELVVTASRYVGQWEEFARFTADMDGEATFEIPAVGYVAGVPAQRGMGNVQLEVVVQEKATGYEEKTTRLLTVAQSELSLQLIPEGSSFKPGLPFNFLLVTETPDNQPVDAQVELSINYLDKDFQYFDQETQRVQTEKGKALVTVTPPSDAIALEAQAQSGDAYAWKMVQAGYSPTGHFIHVEQVSSPPSVPPKVGGEEGGAVGDSVEFKVHSTGEAATFYYEVLSRGRVVFTDYTRSDTISFQLTPLMAPSSKLLVYQILPNSEVAADWLPFDVEGDYPHQFSASFSSDEVSPADELEIQVQGEGPSRVGLAVVDRSVYILAENRLNLQQVFDELERLYMEPQVELHEVGWMPTIVAPGARETFEETGMVVLTNRNLPTGKEYERQDMFLNRGAVIVEKEVVAEVEAPIAMPTAAPAVGAPPGLAEVQRVRQFFPETWIWATLDTDPNGKGNLSVVAPDTITTWQLRAVGISKEKGLGVAEDQLRVFQPFFLTVDLPYSCIRGEEFPVRVALYNYLEEPQEIYVEIEGADWFELHDEPTKVVTIPAGDIGGVSFDIRPNSLGTQKVKVTARSTQAADAVIKDIIVEPEGVQREKVENLVLSAPSSRVLTTALPYGIVEGSARAYLAVTASYLAQTIEGLEGLLIMPFGCGEQNMMGLAPDIFIARYLEETGQMKPEVMAKAELLMTTGYQRQLTFRRSDASFSAFGQSDPEGSLFLTAFVLKTFAQAKGLMYVDPQILSSAQDWIIHHQNADGSFDPVGFVCHQEMMGGLTGKTTLTAYVAIALLEAGEKEASRAALLYLQEELPAINDPYTMALVAYALELGENPGRDMAYGKLMDMVSEDEDGLRWASAEAGEFHGSLAVEATGYALMALLEHGDPLNAGRAARWLVTQRNAFGGFNSTQDTVVGIQALTAFAAGSRADVDLTVKVQTEKTSEQLHISPENYDVLQLVELPVDEDVAISVEGEGQAVAQLVLRYNLPQAEKEMEIFHIEVDYDTHQVEVNDRIEIGVEVEFDPPLPIKAGMTVLDISVPTGFVPVEESIQEVVEAEPLMKRYDIAARKVIFYIEDMAPGDKMQFKFEALASYPVRAKGVTSEVYAYYKPEWKGETLSQPVVVGE
jgi:CD109 antigen